MKYVSDVITKFELTKWKLGDKILIKAGTGKGKSYFFGNRIFEYCKETKSRALILSNRDALKSQNAMMLTGKTEYINYCNYQALENSILKNEIAAETLFSQYDIIAFDECQYFFVDSSFNHSTNLLLEYCKSKHEYKIMLFMSATPQVLLEYIPAEMFEHRYTIKSDYRHIKNIVFYQSDADVETIVDDLPKKDKAIYFSNDVIDSYTLAIKNDNKGYRFVCSKHNNTLKRKSDKVTYAEIIKSEKFNCKVLATTKVLDNGINLKDKDLKHILIDIHEPISIVQCVGRKRLIANEDNTTTLYFKLPTQKQILMSRTNYLRCLNNKKSNVAKVVFAKYMYYCYGNILKVGYQQFICDLFDFPIYKAQVQNMDKEQIALSETLEEYIGLRMFTDMQQDFKDNFSSGIFNTKNPAYRRRGFKSLQAIIEEDNLPYQLNRGRDRTDGVDKWYWTVTRKEITTDCHDLED